MNYRFTFSASLAFLCFYACEADSERGRDSSDAASRANPSSSGREDASTRAADASGPIVDAAQLAADSRSPVERDARAERDAAPLPVEIGACPGHELGDARPELTRCNNDSECPAQGQVTVRCLQQQPSGCGGELQPGECQQDGDCAADHVCSGASCGPLQCVPSCTATSCGDRAECLNGRCQPIRCGGSGFTCPPTTHCLPDYAGGDENGCAPLACKTLDDCPCGSCVNGSCAPHQGLCFVLLDMIP